VACQPRLQVFDLDSVKSSLFPVNIVTLYLGCLIVSGELKNGTYPVYKKNDILKNMHIMSVFSKPSVLEADQVASRYFLCDVCEGKKYKYFLWFDMLK
jgi:hypothetical protein